MSDGVASGIVQADTLETFAEVHLGSVDGSPFVSEAKVHFNDDGFRTSVVDPANVGMHEDIRLDAAAFESYDAPGSATVGVNMDRLAEVLDLAGSADALVEFTLDMETRKLHFNLSRGIHQTMRLIDPDAIRDEPDPADVDLPNTVTLTGEQISRMLDMAQLNSDHVDVAFDPDAETVTFDAQGDTDNGQAVFGATDDAEDPEDIHAAEETMSLFSLDYLEGMTAAIPDDATVLFQFGDEFPTRFSWVTCDGDLSVESMLAPRIQSR
jgi:proliferating cell nuclear antigen